MPDPAALPWINSHGELAHPDAPRGGGGSGVARIPRPLGIGAGANPRAIPAPDAGAARSITQTQLADKVGDGNPKTPAEIEKEKQQANQNLSIYVVQTAEEMVGSPSVGNKECAALLDDVLTKLGGKSVRDYMHLSPTRDMSQNYQWGDLEPDQSQIRPGDLLQFRDFRTKYTSKKGDDTTWYEQIRGPQHSSIVVAKNADGSFEVVEQHVKDHITGKESPVILKNHLDIRQRQFSLPDGTAVKVEVSGTLWVYHPAVKPKQATVKTPR